MTGSEEETIEDREQADALRAQGRAITMKAIFIAAGLTGIAFFV